MPQNIEKKITTEYISMDPNEDEFGFEPSVKPDNILEIEEGFDGFGDNSDSEEFDPEFDHEATQNVINSKKNLHLMELDNGNEDDMNEADARILITDCEKKNKNKNKNLEKESCWNQVILIYTRKIINNIIKKIQSDAELLNEFEAFKKKIKLDTKDHIENLFIHIDNISTANALANINPFKSNSELKYAINLDKHLDKRSDLNFTIYEENDDKNILRWDYLIHFIDKIHEKNPHLGYKYYNKIYFFLKWEEYYLEIKQLQSNSQKNYFYRIAGKLINSMLSSESFFDFKLKKNMDFSNKESIIKFLSSDCSDLIESDKNIGQTYVGYGGRKRRTRRRKHFRRGTSSKCHKTLKRKGKKTLKRKHFRRGTRSKCHKTLKRK